MGIVISRPQDVDPNLQLELMPDLTYGTEAPGMLSRIVRNRFGAISAFLENSALFCSKVMES